MSLKLKRGNVWFKRALVPLVALVIFGAGVSTGNGQFGVLLHRHFASASGGLPNNLDYSSVNDVYQSLKANYNGKLTADQLTDGLKHGLAEATKDPYTVYFTADEAKVFNSDLNQSLTGIGAQLEQDTDKSIVVVSPLVGSPAEKAGM